MRYACPRVPRNHRQSLQQRAALLAGVALLGLVALPLLHAESHAQERRLLRAQAARRAFALGFLSHRSPAEEADLRSSAEVAFGRGAPESAAPTAPQHLHDGVPHHSHGASRHGEGALEHLGLSLSAAPATPALAPPPALPEHVTPSPAPAPLLARYLVPQFAQGPPR